MKALEDKILNEGIVKSGDVLKVDSFLNHQIDVTFLNEIGKEFYRLFKDNGITKILTIEASGIGVAVMTAQYFDVKVVFAKKARQPIFLMMFIIRMFILIRIKLIMK